MEGDVVYEYFEADREVPNGTSKPTIIPGQKLADLGHTPETARAAGLKIVYKCTGGQWWFNRPAIVIMNELLGIPVERGKVNNLLSLADGDINLWYYLGLMPEELCAEHGEEWVNFILGPLAAALKTKGLGFAGRDHVVYSGGLLMMFEAMGLGLVPKGARKALYEAMTTRFNDRLLELGGFGVECCRVAFYELLAEAVEPIFNEAGAGELDAMIDTVLAANPKQAGEAKGDPKIVGWIMGQVMRSSPTKLDPNTVRAAIIAKL